MSREQDPEGVMKYRDAHKGEVCYIVGKGSSIDTFEFEDIPKIGINDVGVVYPVDYALVGPDNNNANWLDNSKLWEKSVVFANYGRGNEHTVVYYKTKKVAMWDNFLYIKGNTVSLALSLAKLMGFAKCIMVGFGDKKHSKHWLKKRGRNKKIDSETHTWDGAYGFEGTQKQLISEVASDLQMEIEYAS